MRKRTELSNIVKSCEARFDRGPSTEWKHSDFNDLSRQIRRETKVVISYSTLKRIFGKISVDDDYWPQQATLDALKSYGRYIPTDFSESVDKPIEDQPKPIPAGEVISTAIEKQPIERKKSKLLLPLAALVLAACALGYYQFNRESNLKGSLVFSGLEGKLPATAFFELNVPESEDSLFINFGDKSKFVNVTRSSKTIAHNYLYPGVFKVLLQSRRKNIDSANVTISSDNWLIFAYQRLADLPKHYFISTNLKKDKDSVLFIPSSRFYNSGIDSAVSYFTRLCNFSPRKEVSPDNFIFETTVRNLIQGKELTCSSTKFQISGIDNFIRFKLVSSGCSVWVVNVISELSYEGNKKKLSEFVVDLNKWNRIKIINKNKHVSFFVDERLIFETTYKQSLGELQGVFLEFEGNGMVKSFDLKTLEGKTLYHF